MNKQIKLFTGKFNALKLSERLLLGLVVITVAGVGWWHFYAAPLDSQIHALDEANNQINAQLEITRLTLKSVRSRIDAGVHQQKEQQIASLYQALKQLEESLRLKTIELVDPEQMFRLMSQLVYKESKLKLLNLKRREVKSAIPPDANQPLDSGIYRHVLEVKFSGKFLDILKYMQSLEAIDWKLIWEEIEIVSNDYPEISVKIVISTLSTRKEWVGI